MRRKWILLSLLCAACCTSRGASMREKFDAVQSEFSKAREAYEAKFRAAKTDEEREKAGASYPQAKERVGPLLEMVVAAPTDPAALDVLSWIVEHSYYSPEGDQAFGLLEKYQAANPHLKKHPQVFSYAGWSTKPAAVQFLRSTLEKNSDREAQADACLALGKALKGTNPGEAEKYFVLATEKYAKEGPNILQSAEAELFEVRNLAVGKVAPDITGEDLNGKKLALSSYRGKVVVLDFWGDW